MQQMQDICGMLRLSLPTDMKLDQKHNYILLCKKGVSNVLKGVASKQFSEGKHPDHHFYYRAIKHDYFWNASLPLIDVQRKNTPWVPSPASISVPIDPFQLPIGLLVGGQLHALEEVYLFFEPQRHTWTMQLAIANFFRIIDSSDNFYCTVSQFCSQNAFCKANRQSLQHSKKFHGSLRNFAEWKVMAICCSLHCILSNYLELLKRE